MEEYVSTVNKDKLTPNETSEQTQGPELLIRQMKDNYDSFWRDEMASSLQRLEAVYKQSLPVLKLKAQLSQQLGPILRELPHWYQQFAPVLEIQTKWVKEIAPLLKQIHQSLQITTPLLKQAIKMQQNFQEMIQYEDEAAKEFSKSRLLLAPSMPLSLVRKVVLLSKADKHRQASQSISNYYRKNGCLVLRRVITSWENNPVFIPRMRIIWDAFDAHLQRRYTLSVPTLLAQIEGVASDISKRNPSGQARLGKSKAIVTGVVNSKKTTFSHAMYDSLLSFIDEPLYKSRDFERDYSVLRKFTGLSRHGILHGLQIKYANHSNSLRAFLVLDILDHIVEE